MNLETWAAFVGTVLVLMSTPGPSQLLILSNSLGSGFRRSMATVAGDLSANFLQMVVASVGLASLVQGSAIFFTLVKWGGVAYLAYLGLGLILSKNAKELDAGATRRGVRPLYWQGFATSAANPKAVVFFAALFPQFLNPDAPLLWQFAILSTTYLLMDGVFLCAYARGALWISRRMGATIRRQFNRISGALLLGAAVLLGLKEAET